jgi:arylsulfatase A-like enzyme
MKKIFLLSYLPILFLFNSCSESKNPKVTQPEERPNIIFIMTDDHATQAMSAYGSRINKTPNLDRIANNGIRFDRTYCTNSICAPSRAVILTGKHSHFNGVLNNAQTFDGSQQTLPKLMKEGGYQTAMIGKWHLKSHPTGFDYWNVLPGQGLYYNPIFIEMGERKEYTGYVTNLTTNFALDWLEKRDEEKPFFLMLQHKAPHRNWMPSPDHLTLYDDVEIPEPASLFDDYQGRTSAASNQEMSIANHMDESYDLKVHTSKNANQGWQKDWMLSRIKSMTEEQRTAWLAAYEPKNQAFIDASLSGKELVKWKYQRYIKDYLRCIASVDDNVGRVLDYLEEEGLDKNTLIIYTSDQGFYLGEHGWYDKRFMYEESYRMPMLMQLPEKIKSGTTSDALLMNLDFAPTMLTFAGLPIPTDMQGKSFQNIATSGKGKLRDAAYYHYFEFPGVHAVKRHYGIRTDRYKLIHYYHDVDEWELFDLENDPQEMTNIYAAESSKGIIEKIKKELQQMQEEYQDTPDNFLPNLNRVSKKHLALNATYEFVQEPHKRYENNALTNLTDGQHWQYSKYTSLPFDTWIGFNENDGEMILDLGKKMPIQNLGINCYQNPDSWIYFPEGIEFSFSDDKNNFENTSTIDLPISQKTLIEGISFFDKKIENAKTRFVKIRVKRKDKIPAGMPGEGKNAWLFIDEIIVE